MGLGERIGMAVLRRMDPERAHDLALTALRRGLVPLSPMRQHPGLAVRIAGLELANPLGLAAGFDKNAVALDALARLGFGFVEVGAVTPRPQAGNPRPRLFRLTEDRAVINRFGFNNDGAEVVAPRLARRPAGMVLGLNLGANKDSPDRAADYASVLRSCGVHCDFVTVNVSSPNTAGLRELQAARALAEVLDRVMAARADLAQPMPVFLKIAPDMEDSALAALAETAMAAGIDAIIATNTTLDRAGLRSPHRGEAGGMSGVPMFERSTRVLARLSQLTAGRVPLVGVGGIDSAETAWTKILAGASALQLYTGLIFGGLSLAGHILDGLEERRITHGYGSIAEAVGTRREAWL